MTYTKYRCNSQNGDKGRKSSEIPIRVWLILGILLISLLYSISISEASTCTNEEVIDSIQSFLLNDSTSDQTYEEYHSCGHFTRSLSYNFSHIPSDSILNQIEMGGILLGYHPRLSGDLNHAMNYLILPEDNSILLIEPQTDKLSILEWTDFRYYRLFSSYNGIYTPSNWDCNYASVKI